MSCNPLEMPDPDLPPVFSGLPAADRSGWEAFRAEYERTPPDDVEGRSTSGRRRRARRRCHDLRFIHQSPDLNLYLYPEEADYRRAAAARPDLAPARARACAGPRCEFEIPENLRDREGSLIYLSLGSLASADVPLMERLVEALADVPHRFIVSKGPQAELYELADNMWGEEFVPQPAILPLVDLVITHGGNNTTTECFHHGKPMIAMPVFWDQHDNAQRVDETGLRRAPRHLRASPTSRCADAIDRLLADDGLQAADGRHRPAAAGEPGHRAGRRPDRTCRRRLTPS